MSDRSDILAPNNTDEEQKEDDELPQSNSGAFDKDDKIVFERLALVADDEYEREHDMNCDNGVYREGYKVEELAIKTGLRPQSVNWDERMKQLKEEKRAELSMRQLQTKPSESFMQANKKPDDLEFIDETVDWTVGEVGTD